AGILVHEGTDCVFYVCYDGKWDHDAGLEALSLLVPIFFKELRPKDILVHFFADNRVLDELEPLLLESGFDDYREGYKFDQPTPRTPFAMMRETFNAYYGDDAVDEF